MKKMILLVTLLTLVAFASGALAQQKPAPAPTPAPATATPPAPAKEEKAKTEKLTGVIEKVDEMGKLLVIKGKEGEKSFAIDDQIKISKGGKEIPLSELKKGMNVSVYYKKDGDKLTAAVVKVSTPKVATTQAPKK